MYIITDEIALHSIQLPLFIKSILKSLVILTRLKTPKNSSKAGLKISNTARKYNKDENMENYDSEVQMYARAHSGP